MFVIFQHGYSIFGAGNTKEAAIADARQYTDIDTDSLKDHIYDALDGDMIIMRCTDRLADVVINEGADIEYTIHRTGDSSQDYVDLEQGAEA